MQIQIEEPEFCKVKADYLAEPAKVQEKRSEVTEQVFKEVSKIQIPGYRVGKAPIQVVKMRYKKQIEERTQQELLAQAQEEILFSTKMKTMFYPQVLKCNLDQNSFECSMLFLKRPEFELKQYRNFEIPRPVPPKNQEELAQQMLQEIRVQMGTQTPYEENDFIQLGDNITMDVKCTQDDNVVPELTKEGDFYAVGKGYFKDFDDNILGMTPGEERTFVVVANPSEPEENQKKLTFTVKLHMGVKHTPAALDDNLAQQVGLANFDLLLSNINSTASNKLVGFEKESVQNQVKQRLLANHDIKLPDWLVQLEMRQICTQHNLSVEGLDADSAKIVREKAEERLKFTLILETLREQEVELQMSQPELLSIIQQKVASMGQDPNQFMVEAQKSGRLFGLMAGVQQEITMDWLVKTCTVVD